MVCRNPNFKERKHAAYCVTMVTAPVLLLNSMILGELNRHTGFKSQVSQTSALIGSTVAIPPQKSSDNFSNDFFQVCIKLSQEKISSVFLTLFTGIKLENFS